MSIYFRKWMKHNLGKENSRKKKQNGQGTKEPDLFEEEQEGQCE